MPGSIDLPGADNSGGPGGQEPTTVPFTINDVLLYAYNIRDAVVGNGGVVEFDEEPMKEGTTSGVLKIENTGDAIRTILFDIVTAESPNITVTESLTLNPGETKNVNFSFPQGNFDSLTARIRMTVSGGGFNTLTFDIEKKDGVVSENNNRFRLVEIAEGYEIRTNDENDVLVAKIFDRDQTNDFESIFRRPSIQGGLTDIRCEVTVTEVQDQGLWGVDVSHRVYNPSLSSSYILPMTVIHDFLSLTSGDRFIGEGQQYVYEVIDTLTTGNSQSAKNGGNGRTGIINDRAIYPDDLAVPAYIWTHRGSYNSLPYNVKYGEFYTIHKECFRAEFAKTIELKTTRTTDDGALGITGWGKNIDLITSTVLTENDFNRTDRVRVNGSNPNDAYVLEPEESFTFTASLRFNIEEGEDTGDFSYIDRYRKICRAFTGDVRYSNNLDASNIITGSFYDDTHADIVDEDMGANPSGWTYIAGGTFVEALFDPSVDISQIFYCFLKPELRGKIKVAAGVPFPNGPEEDPRTNFLEELNRSKFFNNPDPNSWFYDEFSGFLFLNFGSGYDLVNYTDFYVMDDTNPWFFIDEMPERLENGWEDFISNTIVPFRNAGFDWIQIRRLTGSPWRHIGNSMAAFADTDDPDFFPVMADTSSAMVQYLKDNPNVKIHGWWGRSSEMAADFNSTEEEIIWHDNATANVLSWEARELNKLVEWGWIGCGFDVMGRQNYGTLFARANILRQTYGSDFYMPEEPASCDIMISLMGGWLDESKVFEGDDNNELIGSNEMLNFVVPRCMVVAQTTAGSFGQTPITQQSISDLYGAGFKPEVHQNNSSVTNPVSDRKDRPSAVTSAFFITEAGTTKFTWDADPVSATDEYIIQVSRNAAFTDLTYSAYVNGSVNEVSELANDIGSATDRFARITPLNAYYVGDTVEFEGGSTATESDDDSLDALPDPEFISDGSTLSKARRPFMQSSDVSNNSVYGFYRPGIASGISFDRADIFVDGFLFETSELGEYPRAGPHELLNDPEWLSRHEKKVKQDILSRIRNANYEGVVLVDYRGNWHPHFDYSEYDTVNGIFSDSDFDSSICNDGTLYKKDNNFREDFYNYWYCSDPDRVLDFEDDTELEEFMRSEWNSVAREFYEATIRGIRSIVPGAQIGFLDLPSAIYKDERLVNNGPGVVGYGNRFDVIIGDTYNLGQRINSDLSWLWEETDLLCPLISPVRLTVEDNKTPQAGLENTKSTNASYITSNMYEAYRLSLLFETSELFPVFEHIYKAPPPYARNPLNELNWQQQLTIPFKIGSKTIALIYDREEDEDGVVAADYLDEIPKYLPALDPSIDSGGTTSRAVGGLSSTGTDVSIQETEVVDPSETLPQFALASDTGPVLGVDRRPVRVYTLWEDNFLSSDGGSNSFVSWWRDANGVSNLISRMTADYTLGFRRFMLYHPGGNQIINQGYYSPNQWFTMSVARRAELESQIPLWLESRSDAEIFIQGGLRINALDDQSNLDTHNIDYDEAVAPDVINNSLEAEYFELNWNPWRDMGITGIAFHNACEADTSDRFIDLVINQSIFNNKIYGACIPTSDGQLDANRFGFTSWFIPYDQLSEFSNYENLNFDTESTEIGIVLTAQMAFTTQDIDVLQSQGFVIYAAEGTVADNYLFVSEEEEVVETPRFVEVNGAGSDPIEGFGVVRYDPVNADIDGSDPEPDYAEDDLVAVANSVTGLVIFPNPLTKREIVTCDITNPALTNTSLPHITVEDTFEWVNSGMPSHLAQVRDSNLLQMGLNLTKTNEGAMRQVPPYQARYIIPCSSDIYDSFNSTVDFEVLADFGRRNFSIPYPTSVIYVEDRGEVWAGGPGGVLSINTTTYEVSEVVIDSRRELQIKDMFFRDNTVYILDQAALYIYDLDSNTITRDPGLGWSSEVFEIVPFFNTNLAVGSENGIYARRQLQDDWTFVQTTTDDISTMIAPDAGFAIARREVYYSTDGFTWTLIGTTSQNVNSFVKYRNKIYLATDSGIYNDNGGFYAERVSLSLVDVFSDPEESRNIIANDIQASILQVVAGLDDGRLVTIDDFGASVTETGLDTIHKVIIVDEEPWMFSYNTFKLKSQTQLRRLVSGQRL